MSVKRMVTKLALAFAAKKGMEVFRGAGGMSGIRDMLAGNASPETQRGGMLGRIGGTRTSDSGGLGNILSSLGRAGSAGGSEAGMTGQISPINQSLGNLFGSLASAFDERKSPASVSDALNSEFDMTDIQSGAEAKTIIRAMVQMAQADGHIDDAEKSALFDIMHDASPQDQAILQEALSEPVNPKAIAADTPQHARKEVYAAALLIGNPDQPQEKAFLQSLASALELTTRDVEALHTAVGKSYLA